MSGTNARTDSDQSLDSLLAAYSAGSLEAPLHALIGTHLAISPVNRDFVAALDSLRAGELVDMSVPPAVARRDARLTDIFEAPEPVATAPGAAPVLPGPLRAFLGRDLDQIRWKTKIPGVKECMISRDAGGEVSLLWIKAGRRMPAHTHEGSEVTLVLKGGFSDASGHYGRGDIAIADSAIDHRPRADDDGDCICFAVTDAPLHLTGPIGRIVERLFVGKPPKRER